MSAVTNIDDALAEAALRRHHEELALRMIEKSCGFGERTLTISTEDRLRGAMVEAAMWLRENAPDRALDTLEKAMKL